MSAEIRFYHLLRQRLDEALPLLVEKAVGAGLRLHVRCVDKAMIEQIDKCLWTYKPESFLPHAKQGGKFDARQPVLISEENDNINDATALLVVNGADFLISERHQRCLYMFEGRDEAIVTKARTDWKKLKDEGFTMSYWQQRENGGWEQKA